jgi:nucleoside-diphosphate-sugar epimerase
MKVVVIGATGNVGTALLDALESDPEVSEVVGVARRRPSVERPKVRWAVADVARDDLHDHLRRAAACVHLAWLIQPSRDREALWRTNVEGSTRVARAVADAGVPALVDASSVGAYSPGPSTRRVDERWPTAGIATNAYSLAKAEVERRLDRLEAERPDLRVVRLRPGLVFGREAASGIRRLFAGPLLPSSLVRRGVLLRVPDPGVRLQVVHRADVAEAYRLAIHADVRGAFNVAAEPVLDVPAIAAILGSRPLRVPSAALRGAIALSWRLRLQPTPADWLDLGLSVPLMDTTRARAELGWAPVHTADDSLRELLDGLRERAGVPTPPLDPRIGGPLRLRELLTRVGGRDRAGR